MLSGTTTTALSRVEESTRTCRMHKMQTNYEILAGKRIVNVYDRPGSTLIRLDDRTEIILINAIIIKNEDEISIGNQEG